MYSIETINLTHKFSEQETALNRVNIQVIENTIHGFLGPTIILTARIKNAHKMSELYVTDDFWLRLWNQTWESMAAFLLPIGIILAASLITQIEYWTRAQDVWPGV